MSYERKHDQTSPKSWFRLFMRFGGWVAIILGVLLIIMTLVAESRLWMADQLDADGRHARAVVMDKRTEVSIDSDGDRSTEYFMTFRYKTRDGGMEAEVEVDETFYWDVAKEDEHVIRYLRTSPETIEYKDGYYRRSGIVFRTIGLVLGIAGLAGLWFFGGKASRAIRARRFGEKRLATVTEIAETNVEINEKRQARLVWVEDDGQTGRSLMRDERYLSARYKAGDKIVVFRLGDDVHWEGDVGPPMREMEE